jgi:hypothetical protein
MGNGHRLEAHGQHEIGFGRVEREKASKSKNWVSWYKLKRQQASIIALYLCMLEIFHADPSNDDPHPSHDGSQDDQGRVVPNDRQSGIILKLRRRIWFLFNIPSPAPYTQTAPHANSKDDPSDDQDYPTPSLRLGVVVGVVCVVY